jgi:hypothetical protein
LKAGPSMNSTLSFLGQAPDCGLAFPEEDATEGYTECVASSPSLARRFTPPRDVMDFPNAMRILQLELRISDLARQCKTLQKRVEQLEEAATSVVVPVNTFAPRKFEATKQILVLVEPVVDESREPCEYIASFVDGAISATGDTVEEAVSLLKSRMAEQYTLLTKLPHHRLGKIPQQQLTALQSVMQRIP